MIIIQVSDNGEGIPPEHFARIGERHWTTKDRMLGGRLAGATVQSKGGLAAARSDPVDSSPLLQTDELPPPQGGAIQGGEGGRPAAERKGGSGGGTSEEWRKLVYGVSGEFLANLRHS